jgi:hypothetical protein
MTVVDEYKVARLKRNRTDLEVNSHARVWVCSLKSCHAIFKLEKNLAYHMTCHKGDHRLFKSAQLEFFIMLAKLVSIFFCNICDMGNFCR